MICAVTVKDLDEDLLDDLRTTIREDVARGEDDFEEIVESAVEYLDGEEEPETAEAAARAIAAEEFAAHAEAQRGWGDGPLDTDRLDEAFAELDAAGIIARADFTCCIICGFSEIYGEAEEGATPRGVVFCHNQDVNSAIEGGDVHLAFAGDPSETTPRIAAEIVETLGRHGLETEWNGDTDRRILVRMEWRVRREGALAEYPAAPGPAAP